MGLGSMVQEMGAGLGGDNPLNPSSVQWPRRFGVLQGKLRHRQAAAWPEPSLSWRWQRRCLLSLILQSQEVREEKNSFALIFTKLLIELH